MKTKTIKNLLIISAVTAAAITIPAVVVTTLNNKNNVQPNSISTMTNLNLSQINSNSIYNSKFAASSPETISKYDAANSNITASNISSISDITNNMTITVPGYLTIAAWKAAAYKNGINGTQQGGNIKSSGIIGGLQFLLNDQAWSGTPFITWSYTANMSNTSIETPQPAGQDFIYIRVFPAGSNAWFGVKVTGFATNTTVSKYNAANTNIAVDNTNNVASIYNNMAITVPNNLTIASWKAAAYKDGINGTLQGSHINTNGNVGGLQFLLNNQAWSGTPFITWSYAANMSNTSIETPQPEGQDFIYIRVFPTSGGWFGVKVTGFATSNQDSIPNDSTLTLPSDITLNANGSNVYSLQANNNNIGALLTNLPQLPSGFTYVYSVSNNNSATAILDGTITLRIQIYDAATNISTASKRLTLSGFKQGIVVNPYFTVGTPILNNITVVVAKDTSIYTLSSASSDFISNLTKPVSNVLINGQVTPDISIFLTSTGQSLPNGNGILFGLSANLYSEANDIGINTSTMYLKIQSINGAYSIFQINNLQNTAWFLQSIANKVTSSDLKINPAIKDISPKNVNQSNLSSFVTFNSSSLIFNKDINYNVQLQSTNAIAGAITVSVMVTYSVGEAQSIFITIPGFLTQDQETKNNEIISKGLSNISLNANNSNLYSLQVNNNNIGTLLANLPQLPNGLVYIYSVSNNNSVAAISNGTITLNVEVYQAITNSIILSKTLTLSGFKQGIVVNPYFTVGNPILSNNISVVVAKDTSIYALSSASSDFISNLTKPVSNVLIDGQISPNLSVFNSPTGQSLANGTGILFGLSTDLYSQANDVGINTSTMYLKLQDLSGPSAIYQINNLQDTAWFLQTIANKVTRENININSSIKNVNPTTVTQTNLSSYITFNNNSLPLYKGISYNIQLESTSQSANSGQIIISVMVTYSVGAAQSIFITIPGFLSKNGEDKQIFKTIANISQTIF